MSLLVILIILVLLFGGGGGGYYAHSRCGGAGLGGALGLVSGPRVNLPRDWPAGNSA
jgi:hypothetical protein